MTLTENPTGKVQAIMMTESAYFKYVYCDLGNGTYEPEQVEIDDREYYRLLLENPARYTEPNYVAFEVDMEETIVGSDHREWMDSLDDQDYFQAGTGRW